MLSLYCQRPHWVYLLETDSTTCGMANAFIYIYTSMATTSWDGELPNKAAMVHCWPVVGYIFVCLYAFHFAIPFLCGLFSCLSRLVCGWQHKAETQPVPGDQPSWLRQCHYYRNAPRETLVALVFEIDLWRCDQVNTGLPCNYVQR